MDNQKGANVLKNAGVVRAKGFTLIEMMVTVTLLSILAALAMPAMNGWIQNSKVRAVSDSLQNGLRLAQAEAVRRSRQTVFSLTNSASPETSLTAATNGKYWSINSVAISGEATDVAAFVEAGVLGSEGANVAISGPASICFSSLGRLVVNASPGIAGADCAAGDIPARYNISATGADRALRVTVAVGGQVRMCDPAKTLSTTAPDGCPP
jgi:type IV fimbrial biogenesis protein FimT